MLLSRESSVTGIKTFVRTQGIKHVNIWRRHIVAAWLPAEHGGCRIVLRLAGRGRSHTRGYTQQQVVVRDSAPQAENPTSSRDGILPETFEITFYLCAMQLKTL